MNSIAKPFIYLITGLIALNLSSCIYTNRPTNTAHLPTTPTINPTTKAKTPIEQPFREKPFTQQQTATAKSTPANNTVKVILYRSDSQCQALIPEKVSVPKSQPVTAVIGKILEKEDTADLSVSGYRVSINPDNGVATVDLRSSPDSRWRLTSLSLCEQFALFGSLRKTLISNSQWKIKDVRFTERGQTIGI